MDNNHRFKRMGGNLVPVNEPALDALHAVDEGSDVIVTLHPSDPAKMEAHRFLFALLRKMHENWKGEAASFDWWRASLKRFLIPGACEVRETKSGPVPKYEDWSPYVLSKKRQMEIIDHAKQVCRDFLEWTDDDIEKAVKQ